MKIKKILPVLLATTALVGCNTSSGKFTPKFIKYSNESDYETSYKAFTLLEVEAKYHKEDLLASFVVNVKMYAKQEEVITVAHSGKKFVNKQINTGNLVIKYDKDNLLFYNIQKTTDELEKSEYSYSNSRISSSMIKDEEVAEEMYQINGDVVVAASKKTQGYEEKTKVTDESKATYFDEMAKESARTYSYSISNLFMYGNYSEESSDSFKFYMDDKLFTNIYSFESNNEEATSSTVDTKKAMKGQVKISDNEYTFKIVQSSYTKTTYKEAYSTSSENYLAGDIKEENSEVCMEISLKYKNVSLKPYDLSKYICSSKLSEVD